MKKEKNYREVIQEVMTTARKYHHYFIIQIIKIATFFMLMSMTTIWWPHGMLKVVKFKKYCLFFSFLTKKKYIVRKKKTRRTRWSKPHNYKVLWWNNDDIFGLWSWPPERPHGNFFLLHNGLQTASKSLHKWIRYWRNNWSELNPKL